MDFRIAHRLPGRIRLRYDRHSLSQRQAALVQALVSMQEGVSSIQMNCISGSILVEYEGVEEAQVLSYVRVLDSRYLENQNLLVNVVVIPQQESLFSLLASMAFRFVVGRFLPLPVRKILSFRAILPRIKQGLLSVLAGKPFCADTLDAAAFLIAYFTGNTSTATSIAFLLNMGDRLEDFTRRKSYDTLAQSILSVEDMVQVLRDGEELSIASRLLQPGDVVVLRCGSVIPADGTVIFGEGMINQSSMTGESLPVRKVVGDALYASTLVEEGELHLEVTAAGQETRASRIVAMIDDSQALKAAAQVRAERVADSLVRYNFLLTAATYFITRDITKAMSTLLVDYSCAIRLSAPICVLAAMRDCAQRGIIVKGGKYLEELRRADVLVFDKTGTLTESNPKVAAIIPFGGRKEDDVLKLAACLEEHFPHSLARAVVKEAADRGIDHREEHSQVEYVVAHGIASTLNGKKLRIGSEHFIFEDEGIPRPKWMKPAVMQAAERGDSLLYFSEGDELAAVIAIHDTIRSEAVDAIRELRELGIQEVVMLTGDGERTAKAIASQAGITSYVAQALPDTKVEYIRSLRKQGHIVAMIGDGINDAPALAEANVGISMGKASSVAGETADIMLPDNGLHDLPQLRRIGCQLEKRIGSNNALIVVINSLLMAGGLAGLVPATVAAMLHNTSTVAISMASMRPLLRDWMPESPA